MPLATTVGICVLANHSFSGEPAKSPVSDQTNQVKVSSRPVPLTNFYFNPDLRFEQTLVPVVDIPVRMNTRSKSAVDSKISPPQQLVSSFTTEALLGFASGVTAFMASVLYARGMMKTKQGTTLGWGISVANDTLSAGCTLALSTLSNFGMWVGRSGGSFIALGVAIKHCSKGSLSRMDKACLGISAAGWLGLIASRGNPIVSSCASQVVSLAVSAVFFKQHNKNPSTISKSAQALYAISATSNLYAMTDVTAGTLIPAVGALLCTGICLSGLLSGLAREYWEGRKVSK